ncbi:hypothetical protein EG329_003753 [Mollisiaceae sp. DMI_Dod_QoI]|nr:hypothetical protein EG329_003753 [Helotiales sp. DMI_Dod_QoI]
MWYFETARSRIPLKEISSNAETFFQAFKGVSELVERAKQALREEAGKLAQSLEKYSDKEGGKPSWRPNGGQTKVMRDVKLSTGTWREIYVLGGWKSVLICVLINTWHRDHKSSDSLKVQFAFWTEVIKKAFFMLLNELDLPPGLQAWVDQQTKGRTELPPPQQLSNSPQQDTNHNVATHYRTEKRPFQQDAGEEGVAFQHPEKRLFTSTNIIHNVNTPNSKVVKFTVAHICKRFFVGICYMERMRSDSKAPVLRIDPGVIGWTLILTGEAPRHLSQWIDSKTACQDIYPSISGENLGNYVMEYLKPQTRLGICLSRSGAGIADLLPLGIEGLLVCLPIGLASLASL